MVIPTDLDCAGIGNGEVALWTWPQANLNPRVGCAIWTARNHKRHTLLMASQPYILYPVRGISMSISCGWGGRIVSDDTCVFVPPEFISTRRDIFYLPGEVPKVRGSAD